MSLNVPVPKLTSHGSTSSLKRSNIQHEDDLAPVPRQKRGNSESSGIGQPSDRPATPLAKQPSHLQRPSTDHRTAETTLYAGKAHRASTFSTEALMAKSRYFQKLLKETPEPLAEQTTFEDADEVSMALFAKWIKDEKSVHGPTDFHSMSHYLGLYVLARKFESEALENHVMDTVRRHYLVENMTASPFRLDYIYTYTQPPCLMRKFLISTAAFRCLDDHTANGEDSTMSDALRASLVKDSQMFGNFEHAMIHAHQSDMQDMRRGPDCAWHKHETTAKCPADDERVEPWQFT